MAAPDPSTIADVAIEVEAGAISDHARMIQRAGGQIRKVLRAALPSLDLAVDADLLAAIHLCLGEKFDPDPLAADEAEQIRVRDESSNAFKQAVVDDAAAYLRTQR